MLQEHPGYLGLCYKTEHPGYLGIWHKSTRVIWELFGNMVQEHHDYLGIWHKITRVIWEYGTRSPGLFGNMVQEHPNYLGIWCGSTRVIWEYGAGAPGLSGNMVKGHPGYLGIDVSAAPGLFGNRHECGTRVIGCQTSGTRVISDYEMKKKKKSRITRVPHGTEIPNNPGYNRITRVIRNFLVENPRVI